VSAQPQARSHAGDSVAGLFAALSIFASLISLAYRPGRLVPFALLLALLAAAMGGSHRRLAGLAIVIGGVCFVVGMALAVLTSHPIY
jgi:hypothetical protein